MQFKYDVCPHDTIVHVAYKLYRMHVVRMMPAQLVTRSTHLTENSEASCLSEDVQRGYFTSVAQPTSFASFGLVGLFPRAVRNVTFQIPAQKAYHWRTGGKEPLTAAGQAQTLLAASRQFSRTIVKHKYC